MDLVLGAGIVGVSTALYLQQYGRNVALLDINGIGNGTSFGNAGLIERTDLLPRVFPRNLGEILYYATNKDPRFHYHLFDLIKLAPWLMQYWHKSNPKNVEKIANYISPLFLQSLDEHKILAKKAGANRLLRANGWLHLSRKPQDLIAAMKIVERARAANLSVSILNGEQIAKSEPLLKEKFTWGIHWHDSASIINPAQYTKKLYDLFIKQGGAMIEGDARNLLEVKNGWALKSNIGNIFAKNAIVALGPHSGIICKYFGYKIPLAFKRGYHMEYGYKEKSKIKIPIIDADNGFVLAPMKNAIRLTTAVEFANIDSKPTPKQLLKVEPIAHSILDMGERKQKNIWLGARPATSDMMPVIGRAPKHNRLWFNFAHAHHGLTLAPISAKLLAQLMVEGKTEIDISAFCASRFS